MRTNWFWLTLLLVYPAHAEIYKSVDESGRVTYSNIRTKGAVKLDLEPLNTLPSHSQRSSTTAGASDGFPNVDHDTQDSRDVMRRDILTQELSTEQALLQQAKQALTEAESMRLGNEKNYQKYLDRVKPFKDTVELHGKNIEALQRELSNLE
ncbi:MAG: DUF4124 domain-containing protein [Burkholderiales bacterium]